MEQEFCRSSYAKHKQDVKFPDKFYVLLLFKDVKKKLEKYGLWLDPNPIPNFHDEFSQSFASKISHIGKAKGMYFAIQGWDKATTDEMSRTFCSIFALLMTRDPKESYQASPFLHSKTKHRATESHLLKFCLIKSYWGATDIHKASAFIWNPLW